MFQTRSTIKLAIIFFLLSVISACSSTPPASTEETPIPEDLSVFKIKTHGKVDKINSWTSLYRWEVINPQTVIVWPQRAKLTY